MRAGKRTGISPIVAEILLISIVLIEAIAIGGFIFGLFGNFTHTAQVSAGVSLSSTNGLNGTITLLNNGDSNTQVIGITLTFGGATCQVLTTSPGLPQTISAGASSVVLTIQSSNCPTATSGDSFSGQVALTNGASLPFAGRFQ